MLAKGKNTARGGSRAMVETIAVTDGELTALSALSGQQLLAIDNEDMTNPEATMIAEETVCVTIPSEECMDVDVDVDEIPSSAQIKVPSSSAVMVSANNIIQGSPMLISAPGQASTSYVVIQSSPGNRVLTTNTAAGKKGLQIPQIRVSAGSASPQFQTIIRPVSASGPPPLLSRAAISVAGIRPLNPQAVNQRGHVLTKVLMPNSGAPRVLTVPSVDSKASFAGDQQRLILGGSQVRFLSGGMKVATIPNISAEAQIGKNDAGKTTVFQTASSIAGSSPQGQAIKVIQTQGHSMGLLTPNRMHQMVPSSVGAKGLIVNKVLPGTGTRVTVMPQGMKSPAKILPAPPNYRENLSTSPQKVIIKQIKPASLSIRLPTTNKVLPSPSGFQPVTIGGKVQYVRLVSVPSPTNPKATITTTAIAKGTPMLTVAATNQSQPISSMKVVPVGPNTPKTVVSKGVAGQKLIIPASLSMTQIKTSVPSSVMSAVSTTTSTASSSVVVLPSTSFQSPKMPDVQTEVLELQLNKDGHSFEEDSDITQVIKEPTLISASKPAKASLPEPNGIKPRKPCNCTKSQCLKLYCDCFANGEFCFQCNCNCCFNNLEHEEDRQRAIRACLERNPNAFRPKIGKGMVGDGRRHNKGCNCKRSGCLKNYCECYEAKIACSNNCKCVGCRNIEDDVDRRSLREMIEVSDQDNPILKSAGLKKKSASSDLPSVKLEDSGRRGKRRSDLIMSDSVVSATCACLVTQAERAQKMELDDCDAEKLIIEEFGRCLVEIISCVTNRTDPVRHEENEADDRGRGESEVEDEIEEGYEEEGMDSEYIGEVEGEDKDPLREDGDDAMEGDGEEDPSSSMSELCDESL